MYGVGITGEISPTNVTTWYQINGFGDIGSAKYDAFGNIVSGTQTAKFGYRGQYHDFETGSIYLRARYYRPTTGRFMTEDPARDGLNWYTYCGNNPVRYIDPCGLEIVISGTEIQVQIILSALQATTDYALQAIYNPKDNTYTVVSLFKMGTSDYPSGDELINRTINYEETITISIHYTSGNNFNLKSLDIHYDPTADPDILTTDPITGNVSVAKRPHYIGLIHELIHVDYNYQTSTTPWAWGIFSGYIKNYSVEKDIPKNELATVGLKYNNWGDITENDIRAEHGLSKRGGY